MAGYSDVTFSGLLERRRREQEMARDYNVPDVVFSSHFPTATRVDNNSSHRDLDNELSANEERHFGGYDYGPSYDYAALLNPPASWPFGSTRDDHSSRYPPYDSAHYPKDMKVQSSSLLDVLPTETSFLEVYPKGDATLTFENDNNQLESIYELNVNIIAERCPILAIAFEESRSGPKLYLETLSSSTAIPFLRFLYTGSYALTGMSYGFIGNTADMYEDVPTSMLFHCKLYRLADIYDLQDLKSQAYVNVLRQCEFGCSSPNMPIDLCAGIRFVYQYLSNHENLIDAIVNYCVSCFLGHRLAQDEGFKKLGYELRPFHQALANNAMGRVFEDNTAAAIIQMPFKPYIPPTYASRECMDRLEDVVYHFHSSDEDEGFLRKRKRVERLSPSDGEVTLPLRTRQDSAKATVEEKEEVRQNENSDLGNKRRASFATETRPPAFRGPIQLRKEKQATPPSDTEYEIIAGPAEVLSGSDSESESDTLVDVKLSDLVSDASHPLAIRTRAPAAAAGDSDSESEWTLL